jgi:hypothetical protein
MFFYFYRKIKERSFEFFPVFIIEPVLLDDAIFRNNFFSIFIKQPVFVISNVNAKALSVNVRCTSLFKRTYPLFVTSGQGFHMFLFWLRFILKYS